MKKRLAVYCFYDKDGIVDDYVVFFLNALSKCVSKIFCVVNGNISDSGRKKLEQCSDEVLERENTNFDAGALSYAVKGKYEEIRQYDELVFCNNSFFGPVYPLEEVFQKMESRPDKSDFWGITVNYYRDADAEKSQKQSLNAYIQPYFIVFSKKVILSSVFADFFKNLPEIKTPSEKASLYEQQLTLALSQAGFSYGCYTDNISLPHADCTVLYPDLLIRNKAPFVKRNAFFTDYASFFAVGRGQNARKCLDYVKSSTSYSVDFIWQHLLRTQKMSVLRQNLNLNYILSSSSCCELINPKIKAALVCYVYYPDDVEECLSYARNAEGLADFYFVSSRDDTLEVAKKCLADSCFASVKFIKKINKGRDLSTYLIDCASLFDSYDYLCFIHDKKSPQLENQQLTRDFFRRCVESMLISREYVINLLNAFETHPKFGVAVMPPLNFGPFYTSDYFENPGNHEHLTQILKTLDINVPYDRNPVAPYGDMFWCRTAAIRRLFSRKWTYDDLPDEPVPIDGTILHALERIHPYVAQASGYYSAWVHPDCAAATYMNNIYYIERTLNEKLFSTYGYTFLPQMVGNIHNSKILADRAAADRIAAEAAAQRMASDRNAAEEASARAAAARLAAEQASERAVADRAAAESAVKIVSSWVDAESDSAVSSVGLVERFRFRRTHKSVRQQLKREKAEVIEFISSQKDLWDPEYYLCRNPDVAKAGYPPLEHYLNSGWKENRDPSEKLVTHDYLLVNPDCRLVGISPLEHYYINSKRRIIFCSFASLKDYILQNGLEILKKSQKFNPEYYTECFRKKHGNVPEGFDPYSYYLEHGAAENVDPEPYFSVRRYLQRFPAIRLYGICPVVHYELIGKYI